MLYQWIYKNFINYSGVKVLGKVFESLHKVLLQVKDPVVNYPIKGKQCKMPFSQMTPYYMQRYPNYDEPLRQICRYMQNKLNSSLRIIDVGANIGDTVLNIDLKDAQYLLIEGVQKYAKLIKENLQAEYEYVLEKAFLSDEKYPGGGYGIEITAGTASIYKADENSGMHFLTLDEVSAAYHFEPDIIKVDTDGFDFKVLRGARQTLKKYSPIIFFEWGIKDLIRNGERSTSIFEMLREYGYQSAILFDNYGNLLTKINTQDETALKLLASYAETAEPVTIWYYDVLLIHKNSVIDSEEFVMSI